MSDDNKQVAKTEEAGLPAEIVDILGEAAGEGATFDRSELSTPFFTILQDLSPQVKKNRPEYIEGAEAGDLFLTTPATILESAHLVFLAHAKVIQGWRDRKAGGGFIGAWKPGGEPQDTVQAEGEYFLRLKEDPQITIIETLQYIAMVCDEESKPIGVAQISFKSTALKYARQLNGQIATRKISAPDGSKVQPPIWGLIIPVTSQDEQNDQHSWYSWKFGEAATITDVDLLVACRDASRKVDPNVFYRETRD